MLVSQNGRNSLTILRLIQITSKLIIIYERAMRATEFLIATEKETPADAVIASHKLMLRAGMIRKLASGLYTWLPLGLRVLRKVEQVVREEMNQAGALEVLMPSVQPAELWQESGRWQEYGGELLRLKDRHQRDFCFGPTHEEVITDLVRNQISSYKQLPINLYQIQTKFRDETRPRFGVMRAREFLMKDAYSFHTTQESLNDTYEKMHQAYCRIFTRLGLDFRAVIADSGSIGGALSHEFHVLAESGEDAIVFSDKSDYAANIERAEAIAQTQSAVAPTQALEKISTPDINTIDALCETLNCKPEQTLKAVLVKGEADENGNQQAVLLLLKGNHSLNEIKAEKLDGVAKPLEMANQAEIEAVNGCAGFCGPLGFTGKIYVDSSAASLSDFITGANEADHHYTGMNWGRDVELPEVVDIRNVEAGDPSPCGQGKLEIKRGIEVGHIFQLGDKYSNAMNAKVLDENGKTQTMLMGCYGVGVSRIVAAAIEQNNDEKGIIWPDAMAPFHIGIVPMHMHKSEAVKSQVELLYQQLSEAGFDVFLDDRDKKVSPGVKFADMELMGIPHRLVISERGLNEGVIEYKSRKQAQSQNIPANNVLETLKELMSL